MPTRLLRIKLDQGLAGNINDIINQSVSIVFSSGRVIFVKILSLSNDELEVENMRKKRSFINLSEIQEIIIDKNS